MRTIIKNGQIINKGLSTKGSLLIKGNIIEKIFTYENQERDFLNNDYTNINIIDAKDLYIIPGVIDDQVHFREPGNTQKGDIETESRAAVLGGITSYMDMPNNNPPATTINSVDTKFEIASKKSYANYSFYLGATNDNIDEITKVDKSKFCGIKVFMGSSTGNMLVNSDDTLNNIFKDSPILIATHCEDEDTIKLNTSIYKNKYGEDIPFEAHPDIRSREACIKSTKKAIELALKNNSRLHILHISTAEEVELIKAAQKINPNITAETCVHYMWFNRNDYSRMGSKIKCNPAIKEESDMIAIRKAVKEGVIEVVATDHAPHLFSEKENKYLSAPSGLPLVQHSLQVMLELVKLGVFTIEEVVNRMCHAPAKCFNIDKRGFIEEMYYADIAIIDMNKSNIVTADNCSYKCKWSPFIGTEFNSNVIHTFVNGAHVVENSEITGERNSQQLKFNR